MRTTEDLRLSLKPGERKALEDLAGDLELSRNRTVALAVETLALLMKRYREGAKKASKKDVRDLFLRVAQAMPARFKDATVVEGRFSDGRPALVMDDEWWIAEDHNGDLMVVRKDGGEIGHISHGDIEVIKLDPEALTGTLVTT